MFSSIDFVEHENPIGEGFFGTLEGCGMIHLIRQHDLHFDSFSWIGALHSLTPHFRQRLS